VSHDPFAELCPCGQQMKEVCPDEGYVAQFQCPAQCGYGPVRKTAQQIAAENAEHSHKGVIVTDLERVVDEVERKEARI
jgi:hypothetical protein